MKYILFGLITICFSGNLFFGVEQVGNKQKINNPTIQQFKNLKLFQTHSPLPPAQSLRPKQSSSGLYGYVDEQDKFIIEPAFENATAFTNGIARVRQHGLWGLINEKGNFTLRPKYAEIQEFKNQTAVIANPGKSSTTWLYGLLDVQGKELISPQFHYFTPDYLNQLFIVGNILAYENNSRKIRFGLVNRKNLKIIPIDFKEIKHTRFRTFAGKDEQNLWRFFDADGKNIFAGRHLAINDFDETIASVKKVSGWGMVIPNGTFVTDTIYQNAVRKNTARFDLLPFPQKRALDEKNNTLFSAYYTDLKALGENILCYEKNGKKGLIDAKGNLLTENLYEEISYFKAGNCVAKIAETYPILTKTGKPLLSETFEKAEIDSLSGTLKLRQNGRWQIRNRLGKIITQVQYEEIKMQPYGMMFARQGSQWFLLNAEGKIAGSKTFEQVADFQGISCIVKWKGKTGLINSKSEWLIEPVYDSLKYLNSNLFLGFENNRMNILSIFTKNLKIGVDKIETLPGGRYFRIFTSGKQGILDSRGTEILPPVYDKISDFAKDSLLTLDNEGKKGLSTLRGVIILPLEAGYEEMYVSQEERIAIKIKGKYGFIDRNGGLRIAHRYEAVEPFTEGLAAFKLKGKWGFLNLKEELVIQPQYEQVCNFYKGIACVKKLGKWAFMNKKGQEILRPQFDRVTQLPSGKYLTETAGKKGLVSAEGKEILFPGFDSVQFLPNGNLLVSRNGKWGLLNAEGQDLIPVMYDNLQVLGNQIVATIQPPAFSFELK